MEQNTEIEFLFSKYIENTCTGDEVVRLLNYFETAENETYLIELIRKYGSAYNQTADDNFNTLLEDTLQKLKENIAEQDGMVLLEMKPKTINKHIWIKLAAAVIVVFMFTSVGYFILKQSRPMMDHQNTASEVIEDVSPGKYDAVLTLDNGTIFNLDSTNNGELISLKKIKIIKEDGKITYKQILNNGFDTKPVYSTVSTFKGNEYHLVLSDGSEVWLNAESSIRFPIAFSADERRVQIKGEVYFEVATLPSVPFKVEVDSHVSKGEIEVLGTRFNVNAYPEEATVKTTLLEGSVKINRAGETKTLFPGEQASYNQASLTIKKDVNTDDIIAWKNGLFVFNNTDLKTILQNMARWYNVEVITEGTLPRDGFTGKISKSLPLSKFLKVLELNGVQSQLNGRTVIIGL